MAFARQDLAGLELAGADPLTQDPGELLPQRCRVQVVDRHRHDVTDRLNDLRIRSVLNVLYVLYELDVQLAGAHTT
ncbi:hypothetical protein GCM10010140_62350 [Streptosporangium pseudovulgare]|uniref:Uncharacterized protein n=1 Tax=Streptosporangium pseudovulgare TaxID=35765 RepID=A0ABQ2REY1_9ACTN|nr:hypothetical protein GCM10010140_62350 [Streptosporangium pseudovulgare]